MYTKEQFLKQDQLITGIENNLPYDFSRYIPVRIESQEYKDALKLGMEMHTCLMSRGINPFA